MGCWSEEYIGRYMVRGVFMVGPGGWVKVGGLAVTGVGDGGAGGGY